MTGETFDNTIVKTTISTIIKCFLKMLLHVVNYSDPKLQHIKYLKANKYNHKQNDLLEDRLPLGNEQ